MSRGGDTLASLFEALHGHGDRTAVIEFGPDDKRETSYRELSDLVDRFARGARAAGLESGDAALLLGATRLPWIVTCLGLLRAGAVPVPLDTQLSDDNLERITGDSAAKWALCDEGQSGRLDEAGFDGDIWLLDAGDDRDRGWRELCARPEAKTDDEADDRDRGPNQPARDLPQPGPDDIALLFYTSGTTGPPKGVPLSQRNLAFQLETIDEAGLVEHDDRMLQPLPGHHVYPLVVGTLVPFRLGLAVVLPRSMTGPQLVRAIDEAEVSIILGVPRLYSALLAGIERRLETGGRIRAAAGRGVLALATFLRRRLRWRAGKRLLAPLHQRLGPNLRVMASGGSAIDPDLAWRLEGVGWQVAVGYGLTETSPLLTINPPGGNHPDSVGRPVPGMDVCIDPAAHPAAAGDDDAHDDHDDGGLTADPNVEGEILARGPGVFEGYHRLEEKTEDSFTNGWFRTGDLGRFDADGRLYVTGRRKTLIVTAAGENVQPDEIEQAYEKHEDIEEAGVLAVDDSLAAVIVPSRDAADSDDVRERIRDALAERAKSLPSHHRVDDFEISREPLDRTRLGKIQRHRLEERYAALRESDAGPDERKREREPAHLRDLSAEDQQLLRDDRARAAWNLLVEDYPDKPVHPDADLRLDLEIDSLGWLDLTMELAQRTGVELEEKRIVELESVRDLLEALTEGSEAEDVDPRAPLRDPGAVLDEEQKYWLKPLPRPAAATAHLLRGLTRRLMHGLWDLEVEGADHIPDEGPLVLAPNHLSLLDPPAVAAAVPPATLRRLFWGGWTGMVFRNRLIRGFARLARAVPVDPERGFVSSLAFAAAVLKSDRGLVWFPEGERSLDGELGEFRQGLAMLLEEYDDVPVVPVGISGTYEAWPPRTRWPRLRPVRVRFGEPVTGAQLDDRGDGDDARERISRALRDEVAALLPS